MNTTTTRSQSIRCHIDHADAVAAALGGFRNGPPTKNPLTGALEVVVTVSGLTKSLCSTSAYRFLRRDGIVRGATPFNA